MRNDERNRVRFRSRRLRRRLSRHRWHRLLLAEVLATVLRATSATHTRLATASASSAAHATRTSHHVRNARHVVTRHRSRPTRHTRLEPKPWLWLRRHHTWRRLAVVHARHATARNARRGHTVHRRHDTARTHRSLRIALANAFCGLLYAAPRRRTTASRQPFFRSTQSPHAWLLPERKTRQTRTLWKRQTRRA